MTKFYFATLFVMLGTIFCLVYGYICNDSTIFIMGDILGIPFSVAMYVGYRREYHEHERNQ